jgi:hypothetical protein
MWSIVGSFQHFAGTSCLLLQGTDTSVFKMERCRQYVPPKIGDRQRDCTRSHNPEDHTLNLDRHETFKSQIYRHLPSFSVYFPSTFHWFSRYRLNNENCNFRKSMHRYIGYFHLPLCAGWPVWSRSSRDQTDQLEINCHRKLSPLVSVLTAVECHRLDTRLSKKFHTNEMKERETGMAKELLSFSGKPFMKFSCDRLNCVSHFSQGRQSTV